MNERWQESKGWADQFTPHIKMLLGLVCIQVASVDADTKHNTDLLFEVGLHRFPVRVRRLEQRLPFNRRNEITFRFTRQSGMETEFAKMLAGWGDGFLYGWGNEATHRLAAYTVLDLHQFRLWYTEEVIRTRTRPGRMHADRDGSACFLAFCLDCLVPPVIKQRITALPTDPPISDGHWRQAHDPHRAATA